MKLAQLQAISEDEFKAVGTIAAAGSSLRIVRPYEHGRQLSQQLEAKPGKLRHYVDVAHLLYYLYKEGRPLAHPAELGDFDEEKVLDVLDRMHHIFGYDEFTKIKRAKETRHPRPAGLTFDPLWADHG